MADIEIFVPVFLRGRDGKLAYQLARLTGTIDSRKCPEGAPMINSRSVQAVPPEALQPPGPEGPGLLIGHRDQVPEFEEGP